MGDARDFKKDKVWSRKFQRSYKASLRKFMGDSRKIYERFDGSFSVF